MHATSMTHMEHIPEGRNRGLSHVSHESGIFGTCIDSHSMMAWWQVHALQYRDQSCSEVMVRGSGLSVPLLIGSIIQGGPYLCNILYTGVLTAMPAAIYAHAHIVNAQPRVFCMYAGVLVHHAPGYEWGTWHGSTRWLAGNTTVHMLQFYSIRAQLPSYLHTSKQISI